MQALIDDGVHLCAKCDAFGRHDYCGDCGTRFFGPDRTWRECDHCKVEVSVPYCPMCGRELDCEELRRWETGDVDLEEEGLRAKRQIEAMMAVDDALARALTNGDMEGLAANRASRGGLASMINEGFGNA